VTSLRRIKNTLHIKLWIAVRASKYEDGKVLNLIAHSVLVTVKSDRNYLIDLSVSFFTIFDPENIIGY
jgi:hypothetical protein